MKPLTDAQMRALEEVEAGRVRWAPYELCYWSTVFPPAIRSDVVRRLVDRGVAEVGEKVGTLSSHRVALTDSGHAALQEARG